MAFRGALYLCFALLSGSAALAATDPLTSQSVSSIVPNKFIFEVSSLSNIPTKRAAKESGSLLHEHLYSALSARGVPFKVDKEFNVAGIFTGAALTLNSTQDVSALQAIPGVQAIRPVAIYERPQPFFTQTIEEYLSSGAKFDGFSPHVMTGVDKVHAEGNSGAGVNIAIIDTGVDYTHPALGGGFGPGFKISRGWDFVGDAYQGPQSTPVPDSDPLDQCNGHGTHVAGIIGANVGTPYGINGVAYSASLSAYRVFGCEGSADDTIIVDAMLMAVKDGHDIITLSLGNDIGWSETTTAVVASRIASSGIIVTVAAGNSGPSGAFFASSPASGVDVIAVASVDNMFFPLQNATIQGATHDPITYFASLPLPVPGPLPIFTMSNDTTVVDDGCNGLPDDAPADLSGFLVVIREGNCGDFTPIFNVFLRGAKTVFLYDGGQGFRSVVSPLSDVNLAMISAADGEWLVTQHAAGVPLTVSFPQTNTSVNFPDPTGGLVSEFSSYGPSYDFGFKPAVAAPGGSILSTFPVKLGSYLLDSGTSMATPFVAGSAALVLAAKGKGPQTGKGMKTLLESTAKRIYLNQNASAPLQTVAQQGAGMIDVYRAIHTTTSVSQGEMVLNDTAHFNGVQQFTLTNHGTQAKKYFINHLPAGTAMTGTFINADGPVPLTNDSIAVQLSTSSLVLAPGQSQVITARFSLPKHNDPSAFPLYSGFIEAASGTENVQVTYLGLGSSLFNRQVIDTQSSPFGSWPIPTMLNWTVEPEMRPEVNYTFVDLDVPFLMYSLTYGSVVVRVDLVDRDFKVPSKRDIIQPESRDVGPHGRPLFTIPQTHRGGTFANVKTFGALSESDYVSRHDWVGGNRFTFVTYRTPTFANGTTIPDGSYRFLMRVLKTFGDPTREEDYETYLSPIIGVFPTPAS